MIELTNQQIEAVQNPGDVLPHRVLNPRTNETFVLVPLEEYQRLKQADYDDSPWTQEELHAIAWEAGAHAGWDDMDEYDEVPERQ
jgi:hypothetical protein